MAIRSLRCPPFLCGSQRVGFSKKCQTVNFCSMKDFNHLNGDNLQRRQAIDSQLLKIGINVQELVNDPKYDGSPALRAYNSFIHPRVQNELTAKITTRVGNQIAFLHRQHRSEIAQYVRNKDKIVKDRSEAGVVLNPIVLILDNVRSANNVGSILRTAETAGVSEVICCGITPHPPHLKLSKTALGATETVPTRHFKSTKDGILSLKADGYSIFGMETTAISERYSLVDYPKKTAFVLGNEVIGVDTEVLENCDKILEIPMFGLKNSLNVASATAVVVFEVLRQWEQKLERPH